MCGSTRSIIPLSWWEMFPLFFPICPPLLFSHTNTLYSWPLWYGEESHEVTWNSHVIQTSQYVLPPPSVCQGHNMFYHHLVHVKGKTPKEEKANVLYGVKCGIQYGCHDAYVHLEKSLTRSMLCYSRICWQQIWAQFVLYLNSECTYMGELWLQLWFKKHCKTQDIVHTIPYFSYHSYWF